jgi:HEAT repeat protein
VSVTLVIWIGVVTFALIAVVIAQLIVVRLVDAARRRRRQNFARVWLPIFFRGMEAVPDVLPEVNERDAMTFLSVWNRLQESLLGESKERLSEVARRAGMTRLAKLLLAEVNLSDRLLAISTLGQLRDRSVRPELLGLARGRELSLSLAAARALVQIDAAAAIDELLPLIVGRDDWPPAAVVRILQEAGPDVISGPLGAAALRASPQRAHKVIRYLALAHSDTVVPVVRQLIEQTDRVETITACLRVFSDASGLDTVRAFLHHPRWEVRVQAINALARMGTAEDEPRLIGLLSDPEWWVRYRAAQALCALPSANLKRLEALGASHADRFARDIMAHVLSERRAA